MLRLLKIEWNKIFYYKATRTFTILYFLILVVIGVILGNIKPEIGGIKLNIAKLGTFDFPEIWQNITYLVAIAKIFIAVIIITNITNEYSNRTLKQNLIDGMSKKEFLSSKVMVNVIFALLSSVFVFGIALVLGKIFSSSGENPMKNVEFVVYYFLKLNLFFSICLFLAIWLRKTAFAFLGLIVLWMGEGAITLVEVLTRAWIGTGLENINPEAFNYTNYLPLNVSSNLIKAPRINPEGFVMGGTIFGIRETEISYVIAALIYMLIFTGLSYWLLKKRDL